MRLIIAALCLALTPALFGADIYYASVAKGSGNGTSCANAYAYNDGTNGWNVAAKQAAGNTLHVCDAITIALNGTALTAAASGTVGNPVTLFFESGGSLSSPAFGTNGAIFINGFNYWTLDGGTAVSGVCGTLAGGLSAGTCNGLIQNTANGTALANQVTTSHGIQITAGSNIEIRNLEVSNIYQNAAVAGSYTDIAGRSTIGVQISGAASNVYIHNNYVHGAETGIALSWSNAIVSGQEVAFNKISDGVWGIEDAGTGAGIGNTGNLLHDNEITSIGAPNWQGPNSQYHADHIITFTCIGCAVFQPYIYNNYIHGDPGASATAFIFATYGSTVGGTAAGTQAVIFNNLIVNESAVNGANGIHIGGGNGGASVKNVIYNNTIIGNHNTNSGILLNSCNVADQPCGDIVKNNIILHWNLGINSVLAGSAVFASTADVDGNVYNDDRTGCASSFMFDAAFVTFAAWQALGYDAGSTCADPALDANYKIQNTSSVAYQRGINLTSLAIPQLESDKAGTGRPVAPTLWDTGSFQFIAAGTQLLTILGNGNANGKVCTDGATCTDGIINAVSTAAVISGTSTHSFTAGASATLTATATSGSFVSFSGGGCTTSPCTITMNSPVTVTVTFQTAVGCSLAFASNSLNASSLASATTVFSGLSGPNSFWFIFGPPPSNLPVYSCPYPFSGCNANGQTGNITPVGSGQYTGGACSNGSCCTGSTAPLNIWTPVGRSAR